MDRYFPHEKLQVYAKAVDFATRSAALSSNWDKKHSVVDHLCRAAESLLLNLAEAARRQSAPGRLNLVDYAIGSSLECAACLDIAYIKRLLTEWQCDQAKHQLCEVTKMLVGLRKGWSLALELREDSSSSEENTEASQPQPFFHHERLEVYRDGLGFMQWFVAQPGGLELSHRLFRQIDQAATGLVLNIAEGNGRYAELDHHRFLQIAANCSVKVAVYLDLSESKALLESSEISKGKEFLRRIAAMLAGM